MAQLNKTQKGITLIELMIAILIGLIVLSATIGIFITSLKSNSDTLKMVRLNQELQAVMTLMTRDIRRSGYWGITTPGTVNAYAFNKNNDVGVNTCIVTKYDIDGDGAAGGNDYIGYKWNTNQIEMKVASASFSCASPGSGWQALTDPLVVLINQPILNIKSYSAASTELNVLTLELTGSLAEDSAVTRTLKETIRLRNDVIN